MVTDALVGSDVWARHAEDDRAVLFWASLLHDVAKPFTTREVQGRIVSPGHSTKGAIEARRVLWELEAPFAIRERIVSLVRWHMVPGHILDRDNAEDLAIRLSVVSEPRLLEVLAGADARGRDGDAGPALDRLRLYGEFMREVGCWDGPFPFANDTSRFEFFRTEGRNPHHVAWEEPRCTVAVMSGLPATGKDTWLANNRPDLPVINRDDIREGLDVAPGEAEGKVTAAATERAKEYLRAKQDFAWSTTALGRDVRGRMIGLLADYGARVEIVYTECSPQVQSQRNAERKNPVPAGAIDKMLRHWEIPDLTECHTLRHAIS